MNKPKLYTYRNGKPIALRKNPNQFIVRQLPDDVPFEAVSKKEQVSSASTRVTCDKKDLESLMEQARQLAPTHHAYEMEDNGKAFLITDRIIVTFKETLTPEQIGEFIGRYALEILYKFSNTKYLFQLTNETGKNPVKLIVELIENEKIIATAEHDLNLEIKKSQLHPDDPAYARQWHLHTHFTHSDYDSRSSANCEGAWTLLNGYGDSDIVVGLTDDGCQMDHPDFDSAGKFPGWGYFNGINLIKLGDIGADPQRMYQSGANHGTSCAGVIAAETDTLLTVGAAPRCRILPIKWESSGASLLISDSKLLIALDYIADKVDILSNSWGGSPWMNFANDVIDRIKELAKSGGKRGKGIVFLWAAGNENCPIQHNSDIDIPYSDGWAFVNNAWTWVEVETSRSFFHNLAGLPGVMHIAALASTAQRSHYSNYGTGIDITAPSSNSHAYFRMPVPGLGITTTTGAAGQVTERFGGTSSATPLVAGIAALVLSANPRLTALDVISILKMTASKDLNLAGYGRTPTASYDQDTSWDVSPVTPFDSGDFIDNGDPEGTWSPWFGHGKVDAAAAVQHALGISNEQTTRIRIVNDSPLIIPDNNPAGIVSQIFVPDSGNIQDLRIKLELEHTYIGDLVVRLTAPDGQRADLHVRDGGGSNNINKTFTQSTTPDLAHFVDRDIKGTWRLEISDHAAIDMGRLVRWTLEADIRSDSTLRFESQANKRIPDNDTAGISDSIIVTENRTIADIAVELDVTHTWIGDLRIELRKVDGPTVVLHNHEGRDGDDIQHTYRIADEPELSKFVGGTVQGEWMLKVVDRASRDVGKLNWWAVIVR